MSGRSIPYGRRDTASAGCEPASPGLLDGVNARIAAIEKRLDVLEAQLGGSTEALRFTAVDMEERITTMERQVRGLLRRTRRPGEKLPGRKR